MTPNPTKTDDLIDAALAHVRALSDWQSRTVSSRENEINLERVQETRLDLIAAACAFDEATLAYVEREDLAVTSKRALS